MCLICSNDVNIPKIEAYKIFALIDDKLQSSFWSAYQGDLNYDVELEMTVKPKEGTNDGFFAFQKFDDAVRIAYQGTKRWNFVSSSLVVLPVTLLDVFAQGFFFAKSADVQCSDGYYSAYQSRKIIVHKNDKVLEEFYDAVIKKYFKIHWIDMPLIVKNVVAQRMPNLVPDKAIF
jgi:hypothetical protein